MKIVDVAERIEPLYFHTLLTGRSSHPVDYSTLALTFVALGQVTTSTEEGLPPSGTARWTVNRVQASSPRARFY